MTQAAQGASPASKLAEDDEHQVDWSTPSFQAKKRDQEAHKGSIFDLIDLDLCDTLFPPGLNNAPALWTRMGCPRSTQELVAFLSGGKQKTTHAKKGWQAGMALILSARQAKGFELTNPQRLLMSNHNHHNEELARLIYDSVNKRTKVKVAKLGGRFVEFLDDLLDQETNRWLRDDWPTYVVRPNASAGTFAQMPQSSQETQSKSGF